MFFKKKPKVEAPIDDIGDDEGDSAADVDIESREIIRMRDRLEGVLVKHTGQAPENIAKDTERNFWMNAEEALAYGIIDQIVEKHQG